MSVRRTLVIPMWREAARIPATVDALAAADVADELLLVDDGSDDDTAAVACRALAAAPVRGEVLCHPHAGKGAAVRAGILAASGRVVGFTDADLSASPGDIDEVFGVVERTGRVAAGRRVGPTGGPLSRRAARATLAAIVRAMGLTSHPDTQCGLKAMPRSAALQVFTELRTDGFAFDVEMLARAEALGYAVEPVPVAWHHREGGTVRLWGDSPRMLAQLWQIRRLDLS